MTPPTVVATQGPESEAQFAIKRIGVVGLGHMGRAFAANLAEDGRQVSVYDRDKERITAFCRPASGVPSGSAILPIAMWC